MATAALFTALLGSGVAHAGVVLPPMTHPAVVEQGETFTLSGASCFGTVTGSLEAPSAGWSDLDLAASGDWSVELTVDPATPPGTYDWDMQCIDDAGSPFYPFTSIEIVPADTSSSSTTSTVTSSSTSSSTSASTTTTAPTTTTARAVAPSTATPTFTG